MRGNIRSFAKNLIPIRNSKQYGVSFSWLSWINEIMKLPVLWSIDEIYEKAWHMMPRQWMLVLVDKLYPEFCQHIQWCKIDTDPLSSIWIQLPPSGKVVRYVEYIDKYQYCNSFIHN